MKETIQGIAQSFHSNPDNNQLSKIYLYIEKKFRFFIYKRCFMQSTFNDEDVDNIITETVLKVKKNIQKWDSKQCKFTTWLYSVINNEIRSYYQYQQKHYNRYVPTELKTTDDDKTISILDFEGSNEVDYNVKNLFVKTIVFKHNDVGKWEVVMPTILQMQTPTFQTYKEAIAHFNCTEDFDIAHTVNDDVLMFQIQFKNEKNIPIKTFNRGNEIEFNYLEKRAIVQRIIEKFVSKNCKELLLDYFTGDYSYNDLVEKHKIPLSCVKSRIHINKKIIQKQIPNYTIHA